MASAPEKGSVAKQEGQPKADGTEKKAQKPEFSMCAGCAGWCCSLYPELTTYDVVRIMELGGKDILEFLDFVEAQEDDALPFKACGQLVKMTLKRRGSSCIFFDNKSPLKCSIHDSKPAVCLAYPYTFISSDGTMMKRVICPKENLRKSDGALDKSTVHDARWEFERYSEFVADWNASARGDEEVKEFFAFAAREMEAEKTPLGSLLRKARRMLRKR
jgi:Fe-S-cluster containining protein